MVLREVLDKELGMYRIKVNDVLGLPICTESSCQSALETARGAARHVRTKHKRKIPRGFATSVAQRANMALNSSHPQRDLYLNAPANNGKLMPLLGVLSDLKVKRNGYMCPVCSNYYGGVADTIRKHIATRHPERVSEFQAYPRVPYLQTVRNGRYFPVHVPQVDGVLCPPSLTPNTVPSESWSPDAHFFQSFLKDIVTLHEASAGKPPIPGFIPQQERDERQLNPFIAESQFNVLLAPFEPVLAAKYAAPAATTWEYRIVHLVRKYLEPIRKLCCNTSPHIRRALYSCGTPDAEHGSFRDLNPKTQEGYASYIARATIMVIRRSVLAEFSSMPQLSDSMQKAVDNLFHEIKENEVPEDRQDLVIMALHAVHKELFLLKVPCTASPSVFQVRWFAVFSSLQVDHMSKEYTITRPHILSQPLAKLMFACRATALWEIHHGRRSSDEDARVESTLDCISVKSNTVFATVQDLFHTAKVVGGDSNLEPNFRLCEKHPKCALLDEKELPIEQFGNAIKRLQHSTQEMLSKYALLGMNISPHYLQALYQPAEEASNTTSGFSFLISEKNNGIFSEAAQALSKHIWRTPSLRAQFFHHNHTPRASMPSRSHKSHSWKKSAISKWLSICLRLQKKILALIHLSSGAPARATELMTHKIRNASGGPLRTIYCEGPMVLLLLRYNKTSKKTRSERLIPRYLDLEGSRLLKTYLAFVRPLEAYLLQFLQDGETDKASLRLHRDFLFVDRGRLFNEYYLRDALNSELRSAGIPFGIRELRQYTDGIVREFLKYTIPYNVLPVDQQAGHTERTANVHYARSKSTPRGLSDADRRSLKLCSIEYHKLLNLRTVQYPPVPDNPPSVPPLQKLHCSTEKNSTVSNLTDPASLLSTSDGKDMYQTLNDLVSRTLDSKFENILEKRRFFDDSSPSQLTMQPSKKSNVSNFASSPRSSSCRSSSVGSAVSLSDNLRLRRSLHFLFPDAPSPNFKSPHQQIAVSAVLSRHSDLLVVLPTGGGKSLLFMLPPFVEPESTVSIVVVPLVALMNDLLKRCKEANIPVATWKDRDSNPSILIIAVEHVTTPEYARLVSNLHRRRRLGRIVVDEVHLFLLWCTFRDSMNSLATVIRPNGCTVPLVLLSATIPPCAEHIVGPHLGTINPQIIRSSTTRTNISYNIIRVPHTESYSPSTVLHHECAAVLQRKVRDLTHSERVIVYCVTRCEAEALYSVLRDRLGVGEVHLYHAGLEPHEKENAERNWNSQLTSVRVMVATSAFGTGIDFPQVRLVLHLGFSRSLIEFAQESGRAGRDGNSARSLVIFSEQYFRQYSRAAAGATLEWSNGQSPPSCLSHGKTNATSTLDAHRFALQQFVSWINNTDVCRRQNLQNYLDGSGNICVYDGSSELCDVCTLKCTDEPPSTCTTLPYAHYKANDPPKNMQACSSVNAMKHIEFYASQRNPDEIEKKVQLFKCLPTPGNNVTESVSYFQEQDEEAKKSVYLFKSLRRQLQDYCIPCFIERGIQSTHHYKDCEYMQSRCIRCYQLDHKAGFKDIRVHHSRCKTKVPYGKRRCYKCGLSKACAGVRLHSTDGSSEPCFKTCRWSQPWEVALYLWSSPKQKKWLTTKFQDLTAYTAKPVASFQEWLFDRSKNPPNLIMLFNSWYSRHENEHTMSSG